MALYATYDQMCHASLMSLNSADSSAATTDSSDMNVLRECILTFSIMTGTESGMRRGIEAFTFALAKSAVP